MFDTSMMYKFNGVEADEKAPDGPNRGARFATDWTFGEERFRVSSIDNHYTTETMIFPIKENGEVDYGEVWVDREFRTNASQHAKFFQEFLENRTQEG